MFEKEYHRLDEQCFTNTISNRNCGYFLIPQFKNILKHWVLGLYEIVLSSTHNLCFS